MEKNVFEKKKDLFIFRLHCDLADHNVQLEQARAKKDIFLIDQQKAFVKYIEKLIVKAEGDLS